MSTDIQKYIRSDVLDRLSANFDRLRVRLAMKKAARQVKNLSTTERWWRVSDAKVIEPSPGEIREKLGY